MAAESHLISNPACRRLLELPALGSKADIAAAFAQKAGFKIPRDPMTIEYLNTILDCVRTTVMAQPQHRWEDSEAALAIMSDAFVACPKGDEYGRAAKELGAVGDLNTALHEFVAGYVMGLISRSGLIETWPPVDPNEPPEWPPPRP